MHEEGKKRYVCIYRLGEEVVCVEERKALVWGGPKRCKEIYNFEANVH